MAFTVRYYPDVLKDDIPLLSAGMRGRIRKVIEAKLMTAPQDFGLPLRKTLKGYWKLRIGDYRIVFKVTGNEAHVMGIGHRKDIYERMSARLGE
ncbi:MAG: type II toxin-antitoxin system RelE/ParE family toxin [Nitrospirae bacterium]|nr:type II toxin-antitoxin system RelE/ParE family toxin [Nitrospirota bacterium]